MNERPLSESKFSGLQNFCTAHGESDDWDVVCDKNNTVLNVTSYNSYTLDQAERLTNTMNTALEAIGQQGTVIMLQDRTDNTQWRIVVNDPSNASLYFQTYLDKNKRPPPLTGT